MSEASIQPSEPEDSACIDVADKPLLFSTDLIHLPGVNLYDAGRIGALHALGDIYASGGRPRWALVTLVINRSTPLQYGQAVMAGVQEACLQEGVDIVGGHTVHGNEAMVGLSVIGVTNPISSKAGRSTWPKVVSLEAHWNGALLSWV